jgi:soluble lytic murein transglycosylase
LLGYRGIYLGDPLSPEAAAAKSQLLLMNAPLSAAERKQHADAMFNAKQYSIAGDEYRALQHSSNELSQSDRDALEIYAAVCDLRLKNLSRQEVEHLPVTGDDSAALKIYLQSELARNMGDTDQHDAFVQQLMAQYPHSRWLEEALYSGGNMYLIRQDDAKAIEDYLALVAAFSEQRICTDRSLARGVALLPSAALSGCCSADGRTNHAISRGRSGSRSPVLAGAAL